MHSNVGGGYPDDSLAHVSLTWILSEARRRGLTLKEPPGSDPDAFTHVRSTQDKDGRICTIREMDSVATTVMGRGAWPLFPTPDFRTTNATA